MSFDVVKCSIDMKTCKKLVDFSFISKYEKFRESEEIYTEVISKITPQITCLTNPRNYTAERIEVNLNYVLVSPLKEVVYPAILKIFSAVPVSCFVHHDEVQDWHRWDELMTLPTKDLNKKNVQTFKFVCYH
jgi:hypothetical protein